MDGRRGMAKAAPPHSNTQTHHPPKKFPGGAHPRHSGPRAGIQNARPFIGARAAHPFAGMRAAHPFAGWVAAHPFVLRLSKGEWMGGGEALLVVGRDFLDSGFRRNDAWGARATAHPFVLRLSKGLS